MILEKLWRVWQKWWFSPVSVEPLALFRIFFGFLICQMCVVHIAPDFLTWYGEHALLPINSVVHAFWHNQPRFDLLLLLPSGDSWLIAYFVSLTVAAIFLTIGFATRYSALWVCFGLISLHHHDPYNINGGDAFLRLMSIFLACSPAGEMFSIDSYLKRKKAVPVRKLFCPWAQRMLQLQVALAYCATSLWKLSGEQWQSGTAVYYATRLDDLIRLQVPFILDNLILLKAMTWFALFIEFAMWTLVWIRPLRYYCLFGALLLHLGIDIFINLPVFEWAFISALILFVEPVDINKVLNWTQQHIERAKLAILPPTKPEQTLRRKSP